MDKICALPRFSAHSDLHSLAHNRLWLGMSLSSSLTVLNCLASNVDETWRLCMWQFNRFDFPPFTWSTLIKWRASRRTFAGALGQSSGFARYSYHDARWFSCRDSNLNGTQLASALFLGFGPLSRFWCSVQQIHSEDVHPPLLWNIVTLSKTMLPKETEA